METDIQRMLDTFEALRQEADVSACFGEPVTMGDRTVIPVARVGYGFGMSAGPEPALRHEELGGETEQAGRESGGAGVVSSPLGVIEVTPAGVRIEPIVDRQRIALVAMLVGAWSLFWLARALEAAFGRED